MNVQIGLDTYKSLVMKFIDEEDTIDKVITRLINDENIAPPDYDEPVNQRDPGFWYRGRWWRSKNAIDVYLMFFETLGQESDTFFREFAARCMQIGNPRSYFAKEKETLYPDNLKLRRYARSLGDWWVDGNISNRQKLDLMHLAADTAGLKLGRDYKISLPNAG